MKDRKKQGKRVESGRGMFWLAGLAVVALGALAGVYAWQTSNRHKPVMVSAAEIKADFG
ncbi:MAG: hypothetical protein M1598_06930 [Actinobacteria bacterium]|nr:hypothetical protein [Actinomycetota bacterium]